MHRPWDRKRRIACPGRRQKLHRRVVRCAAGIVLLLAAGLVSAGCTTVTMNQPLTELAPPGLGPLSTGGYRRVALDPKGASDGLLVVVAFSGGGKRSAAFAYGVLKGMRDFEIEVDARKRRLLDEIDTISAVSGGSFPAAYYALHRDRIFTDFEADFLKRDVESYIWGIYLLPWNWEWWLNPLYGTNDEMAEIYDDLMFHGATYRDLIANGRPFVSINATDISYGTSFSFSQDQFDLICSDLSSFPIARAVAASNGFPVLFTPITLTSYAERCAGREPGWVTAAARQSPESRPFALARLARHYLDPERTRYVHLMDGGIADNLAMRTLINAIIAYSERTEAVRASGQQVIRRVLLMSVDGQASADTSWPRSRTVTSLGQIFEAVSGTQIDSYNFETLTLAREKLQDMKDILIDLRCDEAPIIAGYPCDDVEVYFLHLSLSSIEDAAVRDELGRIPTGLTIPDAAVDQLVAAGESFVANSPVLAAFRRELLRPAAAETAPAGTTAEQ